MISRNSDKSCGSPGFTTNIFFQLWLSKGLLMVIRLKQQGPFILTSFNFNPSMDK